MPVSRRRFLVAACAVPGALASARLIPGASPSTVASAPAQESAFTSSCIVLDLRDGCVLRESLDGFKRGFEAVARPFDCVTEQNLRRSSLLFVPGAALGSATLARKIRDLTREGATVIYESGAAYAGAEDLGAEQDLLAQYFAVRIDSPIHLWPATQAAARPPYVHYEWPNRVMFRDFSRAVPLAAGGKSFAWLGEVPVAGRVQLGAGEFVFLGSPLGPHLKSGDPEALELLRAFVSGS